MPSVLHPVIRPTEDRTAAWNAITSRFEGWVSAIEAGERMNHLPAVYRSLQMEAAAAAVRFYKDGCVTAINGEGPLQLRVAGGGCIILTFSFGVRASFGVFQIPIETDFGWPRADFSMAILQISLLIYSIKVWYEP